MKTQICTLLTLTLLCSCSSDKDKIDASGVFEATEVIVSAEASGRILALDLEEGDHLKTGQSVGAVDSIQLYLKKMQLEKSIGATQSRRQDIAKQIAATQEQIATQKREKRRVENLLRAEAANTKQLDDIHSALAVLEKQLAAQRSTLENNNRGVSAESSSIEIQIAQIEDQLRKCRITAPVSGAVLTKYAEAGEMTAAGKPLFKIADTDTLKLRAYVSAGQLTTLRLNMPVRVYADRGEKDTREYAGRIVWIADQAEFTPKTIQTRDERANLVYAIKVAVANDGLLKIGMYADLKLGE